VRDIAGRRGRLWVFRLLIVQPECRWAAEPRQLLWDCVGAQQHARLRV